VLPVKKSSKERPPVEAWYTTNPCASCRWSYWRCHVERQSHLVMLLPEPSLPRRVAALAWGLGWQGDDVNAQAIDYVVSRQDEKAPEARLPCAP
jgi:hypothetical protein